MKRFIKNNLKVFVSIIISGIIFGGIGVYAANTYLAHDISYTPSNENFEVSNVEDALNELYGSRKYAKKQINENPENFAQTQKQFDIKNLTDNYANLTNDNFFYTSDFYVSGSGLENTISMNLSYNPETGILTVSSNGISNPGVVFAYFRNVYLYFFE